MCTLHGVQGESSWGRELCCVQIALLSRRWRSRYVEMHHCFLCSPEEICKLVPMHASVSNVIVRFFLWRAVLCVVYGQCLSVFVFVHGKELLWQSVEIQKYDGPTLLFYIFVFFATTDTGVLLSRRMSFVS